jgi:hypothetical protein
MVTVMCSGNYTDGVVAACTIGVIPHSPHGVDIPEDTRTPRERWTGSVYVDQAGYVNSRDLEWFVEDVLDKNGVRETLHHLTEKEKEKQTRQFCGGTDLNLASFCKVPDIPHAEHYVEQPDQTHEWCVDREVLLHETTQLMDKLSALEALAMPDEKLDYEDVVAHFLRLNQARKEKFLQSIKLAPPTAEELRPKTPGMVRLSRIITTNQYNKEFEPTTFEPLAVRADLIESVGSSKYPVEFGFHEKPDGYDDMIYHFSPWSFWVPKDFKPCLTVTTQEHGTINIEGNFDVIMDIISRES